MLEHQIEALVARFIDRNIPAGEFSRQFASLYFSVRQDVASSRAANRLCSRIIGPLAEYSRGHRSEESLRGALRGSIRTLPYQTSAAVIVYDERPREHRVAPLAVAAAAVVLCIPSSDVSSPGVSSAVTPPAIQAFVDGIPLVKIASTTEQLVQVPLEYAES
jgi:hypothetical protein